MSLYRTQSAAQLIAQRYRTFLSYWPQPNRQFHVPTRFGETFVISCGADSAPPLLLFHGAGSNSAMWIGDAAAWSAGYKVHAIDMIGEPGFSAETRPPLNSDAYALWLDDVLDALHVDRFSVIGLSLGGWLALGYATRRPARVDRLVLIVPAGIGRQRSSFLFKVLPLLLLGDWGRKKAMQIVIGAAPGASTQGSRAYMEYMAMVQRHFRPRRERLPIFPDSALRQLTMPVLAILGGKDVILDSAETRIRLQRSVPQAQIRYLPDLGHGVFGEREAIHEFLTSPSLDNQIGARR
ncbi:MAG TPA: alpha/beta hydrolase [Steroidobacteraceae bacterium]|jgi:pimeloyl-ACP methyl ester carboxylesterase